MLKNLKTLILKNNVNSNISNLFVSEFDFKNNKQRQKFYMFMDKFLNKYHKPNFDFHSIKNIQCINLQKLSLECCNLTIIPNFVFDLINLTDLNLSRNYIKAKAITDKFKNLTKLTTLNLSDNSIIKITNDYKHLTNLTTLDLTNNKITEIPEIIFALKKLSDVKYTTRIIKKLPANFWDCKNKIINFSDNFILKLFPEKNIESDVHLLINSTLEKIPEKITNVTISISCLDTSGNIFDDMPLDLQILTIKNCGNAYKIQKNINLPPLIKEINLYHDSDKLIFNKLTKIPFDCKINNKF